MDTIEKAIRRLDELDLRSAASPEQSVGRPSAGDNEDKAANAERMPESPPVSTESVAKKSTKRSVELDVEKFRRAGMVVPDDRRSRIKEEYRHIKRPLLMNASGKGATVHEYANLIMVTSAGPGEGKTFTALNLALSIASERDRTVLLVDADVVRPTLSKFCGLHHETGLVDFLIDDRLDLTDVLVETNIPSLSILPAGNTHHLSTELLASKSMGQLVREISKRYHDRIVILDSPPLLITSEASVLASLVGQIVMVVEAEKTRQAQVKEALSLLDPNMIIGFVLNKARRRIGFDYYGYGSYGYYGYGYYGDRE